MYIKTNDQRYRCTGTPVLSGETLRFTLPDGGPEELGATVGLYQEDGFPLREVDVSGYLRWEMAGDTLVITNLPKAEPVEPGPVPEPEPAGMSTEEAMLDMLADHEYRLGLMEVGLGPKGVQQNEQMP